MDGFLGKLLLTKYCIWTCAFGGRSLTGCVDSSNDLLRASELNSFNSLGDYDTSNRYEDNFNL
jgi:hypothetical protein